MADKNSTKLGIVSVLVTLMLGSAPFAEVQRLYSGNLGTSDSRYRILAQLGDIDGDGLTEVLGISGDNADLIHLDRRGNGGYVTRLDDGPWGYDLFAAVGDLGTDGRQDFIGVNTGEGADLLTFNDDGSSDQRSVTAPGETWTFDLVVGVGHLGAGEPTYILATQGKEGFLLSLDAIGNVAEKRRIDGSWRYEALTPIETAGEAFDLFGVNLDAGEDLLVYQPDGRFSGPHLNGNWVSDLVAGVGDPNGDGFPEVLAVFDDTAFVLHLEADNDITLAPLSGKWQYECSNEPATRSGFLGEWIQQPFCIDDAAP